MTVGFIGGCLLVIGALLTFKGDIFKSVGCYCIADVCWVYLAYQSGDVLGTLMTCAGLILGCAAFVKMNIGIFNKTITKD